MTCKNCGKDIWLAWVDPDQYLHTHSGAWTCDDGERHAAPAKN